MNKHNKLTNLNQIFKLKSDKCKHGYDHHSGPHACDSCENNDCPYWVKISFLEEKYLN